MARVLVLTDLYWPFPGGAERLIGNMARELMLRGHTVQVLTGYEAAQPFDGPPVDARSIGTVDEPGWDEVTPVIDGFAPDVILTHHHYCRIFEDQLARLTVPFVQVVLNGRRSEYAVGAVFITEWVRQQAQNARPRDIVVIPPAYGDVVADGHEHAIGFIKPIPHKGTELVYAVARRLPERRFVVLRGEWQDLELLTTLPNVEYMEPVDDIREFYRRVDLVLVPSVSEDAGTVGQECTANDIPCISSDVGGLPETNPGGVLLSTRDVGAWVRAIRAMDDQAKRQVVVERQWALRPDHARQIEAFVAMVEKVAS